MVRHKWMSGAHRPAPPPGHLHGRLRGVAGLVLAVVAVPASWGALLTGVGLPDRTDHTVQFPGIHATHRPDRRPSTPRVAPPVVSPRPSTVPPPSPSTARRRVPADMTPTASPSLSLSPSDTSSPAYEPPPLPPPATTTPPCMPTPTPPRKGHHKK